MNLDRGEARFNFTQSGYSKHTILIFMMHSTGANDFRLYRTTGIMVNSFCNKSQKRYCHRHILGRKQSLSVNDLRHCAGC